MLIISVIAKASKYISIHAEGNGYRGEIALGGMQQKAPATNAQDAKSLQANPAKQKAS